MQSLDARPSESTTKQPLSPLPQASGATNFPSDCQLVMDSLPQEIIDEIINNLRPPSLRSSSLVAKRWRKRSQQRIFHTIRFSSESIVNRWHIVVQSDPDGISSYVRFASFKNIKEWNNPSLFCHLLEGFSSLTTLRLCYTEITGEMLEHVSHGELGRRITVLYLELQSPQCSLSMVIFMILSFSNLQELWISDYGIVECREELPTYHVLPQSGSLNMLNLSGSEVVDKVAEVLKDLRFTSRRLFLDFRIRSARDLLTLSSVIVQELLLVGMLTLCVDHGSGNDDFTDCPHRESSSNLADLPPFPALTSLRIVIWDNSPSPQLLDALSSISSAPALASISIEAIWSLPVSDCSPYTAWANLDGWLVKIAKNAAVELTLIRWWDGKYPAAVLFPKFAEAGKIETIPEMFYDGFRDFRGTSI